MFEKELSKAKSIRELSSLIANSIKNDETEYSKILGNYLIKRINENLIYAKNNIKIVVYPDDSGVDVYFGDDTDILSKKFGWKFYKIKL